MPSGNLWPQRRAALGWGRKQGLLELWCALGREQPPPSQPRLLMAQCAGGQVEVGIWPGRRLRGDWGLRVRVRSEALSHEGCILMWGQRSSLWGTQSEPEASSVAGSGSKTAGASHSKPHHPQPPLGPAAALPPPARAASVRPPSPPSAPGPLQTGTVEVPHPHPRVPYGPALGAPQDPGLTAACHPSC